MLARKHATRFAQPGGNFVEDQAGAEVVACLANLLPETGRGNIGHGPHWFGDDGADITLFLEYIADSLGAQLAAALSDTPSIAIVAKRAARAERRASSGPIGALRNICSPPMLRAAKPEPWIRIPKRNGLESAGDSAGIGDGDFNGVRAARGEENFAQIAGGKLDQPLGQFDGRRAGEIAAAQTLVARVCAVTSRMSRGWAWPMW